MTTEADLDAMTFEEEVDATVRASGVDKPTAEFMTAQRRGEVDGDLGEEPTA